MEKQSDNIDYQQQIKDEIRQKYPGIESEWEKLTEELGPEVYNLLKSQTEENILQLEGIGELHISIIVDTNFVFGQIKGMISKNREFSDSFIYKMFESPFITVLAPHQLKTELFGKINELLSGETTKAISYAEKILTEIQLEDAYWAEDWKIAKQKIGDVDPDDVAFLALSLHSKSHGILSFDNIFGEQQEVKVWTFHDTAKTIKTINHGLVSFAIFGIGVSSVELIYKLFLFIGRVLLDKILTIVSALMVFSSFLLRSVKEIPPSVILTLASLFLVGLFISEDFRDKSKETLSAVFEELKKYMEELVSFLERLKLLINDLWEAFKPAAIASLELLAFLGSETQLMIEKLNRLEMERAKP